MIGDESALRYDEGPTHTDKLDRAWKVGLGEEVTSHLYFHLDISKSSFFAVCR